MIQGNADIPPSPEGENPIAGLIPLFRKITTAQTPIISSDSERCRTSAMILCARCGIQPQLSSQLREVDWGIGTGRRMDELRHYSVERKAWGEMLPDHVWDGGESLEIAHKKADRCLDAFRAASSGSDIVVVTHGTIIRLLSRWWPSRRLHSAKQSVILNGSLTEVDLREDGTGSPRVSNSSA